ncbi:uncharacterized protein T551_02915 [Pneumocystis jirovecii RU7]|uniref:Anaphase-promoting complex subunit 4 WD40 domain-containing protein n=1 Tax=Pneumocystis jirovecii (strain RU7) TaxID=1408657 RepID=A0A0W4ZHV8_PNEJ7|nr:uncharacterized protein T551_02915 [Pneumocystis jirovecii RU7]KTW27948.1 hypothetical protein T551_02915 [Pneumocystis jirovecii RU7]
MESKIILPVSSFLDQKQKTVVYNISGSVVEFCPFEQSSSLLALGNKQGIILLKRTFFEIDELGDVSKLQFKERWGLKQILYVQLGARVTSIAFSPTTYTDIVDVEKFSVTLAIAAEENNAWFLKSSSESKDPKLVTLGGTSGHQDFINDVDITYINITDDVDKMVFTGDIIATGGDDCTAIVWRITNDSPQISAYSTGSPVVSVKFHKFYPRRLLVGEYNKTIKVLDWADAGGKWLIGLCLEHPLYTSVKSNLATCLVDVDWIGNKDDIGRIIAAVSNGSWFLWSFDGKNNNISAFPIVKGCIGSQANVKQIIFRPGHPDIFAICFQGFLKSSISHIKLINVFVGMDPIDIVLPLPETLKPEDSYISWHANEGVIAICRNSSLMISCIMDDNFSLNMRDF